MPKTEGCGAQRFQVDSADFNDPNKRVVLYSCIQKHQLVSSDVHKNQILKCWCIISSLYLCLIWCKGHIPGNVRWQLELIKTKRTAKQHKIPGIDAFLYFRKNNTPAAIVLFTVRPWKMDNWNLSSTAHEHVNCSACTWFIGTTADSFMQE